MKVTRYLLMALLLSVVCATSALALPINKVLTVQLGTVSAKGQFVLIRSISATSDANGKLAFSFANVPTSDSVPFLMVQILDGTTILRQSIAPAPAPNGTANIGLSEVTTSQATAMLKAVLDSGGLSPTLAAMVVTMVRSGALSVTELRNFSPMLRAAANAFESFLANNGAAGQLDAFRANLIPALRDLSATYKESVDVVTLANDASTTNPVQDLQTKEASNVLEATKRGDAIARFLGALVNAGADAGIAPALMQAAFTEAGKAAEATISSVSSDAIAAMIAAFRTGAQHCQLRAQMRSYTVALPFMNVTSVAGSPGFKNMTTIGGQPQFTNMTTSVRVQLFNNAVQKFNAAAATLGNALVTAQETYELIFAAPTVFPALQDITFAQDNLSLTLQSLMTNLMTDTTATPGEIITMQTNMAAGMAQVGGIMANMSTSTLQNRGVGSMFTSASASSQSWLSMMVAGANIVTPSIQLTYSSAVTRLASKFPQVTVPNFSLYGDPYKSLLRLQFDLMLLKFNNQLALSQAVQPITQADLAAIKEADLANRSTVLNSMGGSLSSNQKSALMMVMSQPELL